MRRAIAALIMTGLLFACGASVLHSHEIRSSGPAQGLIPGDTLAHNLGDIAYRTAATTATTGNGAIAERIERARNRRRERSAALSKIGRALDAVPGKRNAKAGVHAKCSILGLCAARSG